MTQTSETPVQGLPARIGASFARALCWLASFPHEAYQTLQDSRARTVVRTRALAVMFGPLVSFVALLMCAQELLPRMPYILLLPFAAFVIDQLITAESYSGHTTHAHFFGRFALAIISVAMALVAGLLAEQVKLLESTRAAELRAIETGSSSISKRFRQFERQASDAAAAIGANEARLMRERPAIVARLSSARALWQKECYGAAGVDPRTGQQIIGGGCGRRAASHKADAQAMEQLLAELDELKADNARLYEQAVEARRQQDALVRQHLSSGKGLGVLLDAFINHADWGTRIWIMLRVFTIGLVELMAWWMSKSVTPVNLRNALRDLEERDERRLELLNARSLLDIGRALPAATFHIESGDPAHEDLRPPGAVAEPNVIALPVAPEGGRR